MTPRVSIILATYNEPRYLARALDSIFSQTFTDWELIIVNDASPHPETKEILARYNDSQIISITNDQNIGSVKSGAKGVAMARGEFIARLDDDDCWVGIDKLQQQVNFLDKHPDHLLIGTNIIVADYDTDKELYRTNYPQSDTAIRENFFTASPFAHSSVMLRRAAMLRAGSYDESLLRVEDYDLWMKLGTTGKLANLAEALVRWRSPSKTKKNVPAIRLRDHVAKLHILWKHRKEYPHFWFNYLKELAKIAPYYLAACVRRPQAMQR